MITPEQIKKKAERQYEAFLRSVLCSESFFPQDFPVGQVPKRYPDLQKAVTDLINDSKAQKGFGYTVELATKNTRKHGPQSLPQRIYISDASDYLKLLEKEQSFANFQADVALIQSAVPALAAWVQRYPLKVVANHEIWPELLKVCQYFQKNPRPNLYIRELPIAVHTKFVEDHKRVLHSLLEESLPAEHLMPVADKQHVFEQRFSLRYREPLVSLRILDRALQTKYGFPVADFSLSISDFAQLQLGTPRCFITENVMPFLTLPLLENSIAILGSGYAVNLLKSVAWLLDCSIFYWGDMDVDGFRILAGVRSHFPQTQSILMDADTYETFERFAVADKKPIVPAPAPLSAAEENLYMHLSTAQKRLEQERISQVYINRLLERLLASF